jgi:hypothetical protein
MNAATIFSESFDELTPTLGVSGPIGGFTTINNTNVDILGPSLYNECFGPESGNCIDLNGSSNGAGSVQGDMESINISIPAAGTYLLSFDLIGTSFSSSPVSATAEVLGASTTYFNQTYTLQPVVGGSVTDLSGVVTNAALTFTGPDTVNIFFSSNTGNGSVNGAILDNVLLTDINGVTTPEPATFLLLGSALLVGTLLRKRIVL